MWTLTFWKDTAERAIKTFAQAAIASLAAGLTGILEVDWLAVLSVALLAALISVLTSIASAPFSNKGTASLEPSIDYK